MRIEKAVLTERLHICMLNAPELAEPCSDMALCMLGRVCDRIANKLLLYYYNYVKCMVEFFVLQPRSERAR